MKCEGSGWTMHLGDCADVFAQLTQVDALITDPPYGVDLGRCGDPRGGAHGMRHEGYGFEDTYENFVESVVPRLNQAIDLAKRGLVWTGPHIHEQRKPTAIGGVFAPSSVGRTPWGFKNLLLALLYGASPTVARGAGATTPTAILSTATSAKEEIGHPVAKPVEWMIWSVRLASEGGETVLDPFAGSGTTGVACLRLGRRFIGVEREKRFFDIAVERLMAEEHGSTLSARRNGQAALFGCGDRTANATKKEK